MFTMYPFFCEGNSNIRSACDRLVQNIAYASAAYLINTDNRYQSM